MVKVKLYLNNASIRRFTLAENTTYEQFLTLLKGFSSSLKEALLMYQDEEKDWISFTSAIEFKEMIEFAKDAKSLLRIKLKEPTRTSCKRMKKEEKKERSSPWKQKTEEKNERSSPWNPKTNDHVVDITHLVSGVLGEHGIKTGKASQDDIVHYDIVCDGCEQANFKGIRYQCKQCNDFDLCAKCHATSSNDHFGGKHEFNQRKLAIKPTGPYSNIVTHIIYENDENEKKEKRKARKVAKRVAKMKRLAKKQERLEQKQNVMSVKKEKKVAKTEEKLAKKEEKVAKKEEKVAKKKEKVAKKKEKVEVIQKIEPTVPVLEFKLPVISGVRKLEEYSIHYDVLESMGFKDIDTSNRLLKKHKGNLQIVVNEYLSLL